MNPDLTQKFENALEELYFENNLKDASPDEKLVYWEYHQEHSYYKELTSEQKILLHEISYLSDLFPEEFSLFYVNGSLNHIE